MQIISENELSWQGQRSNTSPMDSTESLSDQSEIDRSDADTDPKDLSNLWTRRFGCNEPQLQRRRDYRGWLDERGIPEDEMRALFAELADYFGVFSYWDFVLPCSGLPGKATQAYDADEEAATLLRLGIDYTGAIIANERRAMHNRWQAARDLIDKIEDRAGGAAYQRIVDEQLAREAPVTPQAVYFIGAETGPIKIGIAANPQSRLRGLQTGHHEKLSLLATCGGGQTQERAYHTMFADRRLKGEWFERCPEIEAEIHRLQKTAS